MDYFAKMTQFLAEKVVAQQEEANEELAENPRSLKLERKMLGKMTAWMLLQIILCPKGRAQALTCLALLYQRAISRSLKQLIDVLSEMPTAMYKDHPFVTSRSEL